MDTTTILAICAGFSTVSVALNWFITWSQKAKAPYINLESRVDLIEGRLKEIDSKLTNDDTRIKDSEHQSKLILRAVNAILEHELTGNHTQQMEQIRTDISEYLINK